MSNPLELAPADVGIPVPIRANSNPQTHMYDYIVVGGGTAGCVLASRLSEDPAVSVLLIEQGPLADTWASRVPLISGNPYRSGSVARTWWSLPNRDADDMCLEVMRGEALGGTSRINSLLYTRGCPGDYNRWKELGNEGWGYEDVEPYFVKSETTRSHAAARYRGTSGAWKNCQFTDTPYRMMPYVRDALQKRGVACHPDLNSPSMPAVGTGVLDITQDSKYQRHSTNRAFLPRELVEERKARLKVCTETLVTKIHIDTNGDSLCATGVYFEPAHPRKAAQRYFASARKEVILAAGALGSPQLLMLSGIGPKEHLAEKGISVVREMPAVGSYLQDHIGIPFTYEVPMNDSLHELEASPLKAVTELLKYLVTGRGMLSYPFQSSTTLVASRLLDNNSTIISTSPADLDTSYADNRPDIEIMNLMNNSTNFDIPNKGLSSLILAHIRPKSLGSVRLANKNPRALPEVDLGFLSNPDDYVALRKGARLVLRIAADVKSQGYPLQGLIVPDGDSDADIDRFIRANMRTCFHYTSTCRMGKETHGERASVVDTLLRVHGVKGLRVCDASVFPEIIGAHTMAPTVMVAERCADMIKRAT